MQQATTTKAEAPVEDPLSSIQVTISMSESDRWFPATMMNEMMWGNGERVVLGLGRIHDTLKLEEIDLAKMPGALSKTVESYILRADDAEFMMAIMCGKGGKAIIGIVGPQLAKIALRVRTQIDRAVQESKKAEAPAASPPT